MPESHCALIIANSEYQDSVLRQLVAPTQDAEALAAVLRNPSIGGFDVQTLVNETSYRVSEAIEAFLADRDRDDLLLLYFSGHGIKDADGQLYFATSNTQHKLLRSTAVWANFVNDVMRQSRSRRQVLLLDCCHSGAFAKGMMAKSGSASVGAGEVFEGHGRVVLTASDAIQYSFEGNNVEGEGVRSVFTRTLVEGLESGRADLDSDGMVSLDELYDYLRKRIAEEAPQQTPQKWAFVEGEIFIARNPRPMASELPPDIQEAVASLFASTRREAIPKLESLIRGKHRGRALAAFQALVSLKEDDSRQVSSAAEHALAAYAETQRLKEEEERKSAAKRAREEAEQKAEAERLARQAAESERLAAEKAAAEKEQREAEQRVEAERRARQAEAERLAAEKAAAEKAAQEEREAEQRVEAEKAAREQREAEQRVEAERRARQAEAERLATEKAAAEKAAREQREAERARKEKAEEEGRASAAGSLAADQAEAEHATSIESPILPVWPRTSPMRSVVAPLAVIALVGLGFLYFRHRNHPQPSQPNVVQEAPKAEPNQAENSGVSKAPAEEQGAAPASSSGSSTGLAEQGETSTSPPSPAANNPKRISVGGQVQAAKAIFKPSPQYPPLAMKAHIAGTVRLRAVIGTGGTISELKLIQGHPLLAPEAMKTVSRWRYRPTLLNGKPVEVATEIDVNFHLEKPNGASSPAESQTAQAAASGLPGSRSRTMESESQPAQAASGNGTEIGTITPEISPPVPIYQPQAPFTQAALNARREGLVLLDVTLDAQGSVVGVKEVSQPLGAGLDDSAIATVQTWKFRPATRAGSPVPVRIRVKVEFRLS
jgi:TonB family protein